MFNWILFLIQHCTTITRDFHILLYLKSELLQELYKYELIITAPPVVIPQLFWRGIH